MDSDNNDEKISSNNEDAQINNSEESNTTSSSDNATKGTKSNSTKVLHEVEQLAETVGSLEVTKKKKRNVDEDEEDEEENDDIEEDDGDDDENEKEDMIDEEAKELFDPIQKDLLKVRSDYDNERFELEAKYQALFKPLYEKRAVIVSESKDVFRAFWLQTISSIQAIGENIQEHDEAALEFLTDIRVNTLKIGDSYGYSVEFEFAENPFFENKVLTKTLEVSNIFTLGDLEFGNVIGTEIKWKSEDKNLCVLKVSTEDGEVPAGSFFDYFDPKTTLPKEDDENAQLTDEQYMAIQRDYAISEAIRTKVAPDAIKYFTGEYQDDEQGDDYDQDEEEDDEYDEEHGHSHKHGHHHSHGKHGHSHGDDDDDDEDEDDDEDDEDGGNKAQIPKFTFPSNTQGGAPGGANPECKQN